MDTTVVISVALAICLAASALFSLMRKKKRVSAEMLAEQERSRKGTEALRSMGIDADPKGLDGNFRAARQIVDMVQGRK